MRIAASRALAPLIVLTLAAGCDAPQPEAGSTLSTLPAALPSASSTLSPEPIDEFALWVGGPHLVGANIHQRRVYPELDGTELLGPGPFGPPYNQEDFDRLAASGANYVNLSVPGLFRESPPYSLDPSMQAHLDGLLEKASRADLFAVISFRSGPGRSDFSILRDGLGEWFDESYLNETFWTDIEAQHAWADMWRYTADRYRSNPIVVGYDLMVEPNPNALLDIWDPRVFYPAYAGTTYDWNEIHPRIAAAIRQVDRETPILVAASGYSSPDWLPYLARNNDARTVYCVHQYDPHLYTHQDPPDPDLVYGRALDVDYDGDPDEFGRVWAERTIHAIAAFGIEHNVPIAVNELGVARWAPQAASFMNDQLDLISLAGMNWAAWAWEPTWEPWAEEVTTFNLRLGPDPLGTEEDLSNELFQTVARYWRGHGGPRPSNAAGFARTAPPLPTLDEVRTWLYLLDSDLDEDVLAQIETSGYDMVVVDFLPSQADPPDVDMAGVVSLLHEAPRPKLVLAYLDIGQAEDFRSYWQDGWRIGDPAWILAEDVEGWLGDFPVAYWDEEWREIWLAPDGLIAEVAAAAFDGVYLDWVEAYDDEAVVEAAARDGVDPRAEMSRFVGDLATVGRAARPGFLVLAQNAASLLPDQAYIQVLDGIAQEHIWFDGGPEDNPPGDCPLPAAREDVDAADYLAGLSPACRRVYQEQPDGSLHTSSEEYLEGLRPAVRDGIPIFTVDYALLPENVAWVYATARVHGFTPFVTTRALDRYLGPVP